MTRPTGSRRRLGIGALALVLLLAAAWAYQRHLAPTRIAFVNHPEFQLARILQANEGAWVRVDALPVEEVARAKRYSAVYLFGRGLVLTPEQVESLQRAGRGGTRLFVHAATNPDFDVTTLADGDRERVEAYLQNGGTRNYRSLLSYTRRELDGKQWLAGEAEAPAAIPADVFFHLDEHVTFAAAPELEAHLRGLGTYREGAPRVALLTSVPGPFNANRDHLDKIIRVLEGRGLNVYPIAASGQRLALLQQVEPDLVVFMPHGRLTTGDGERAVAWLRERNVPLLSPLSVFQAHDDWVADPKGMFGSMLTMSVVLPEIDGGIAPYAIAAQFGDANGYRIFDAIPERLEAFADQVERWLALKQTPNADKKVAIYYYKGPGLNALAAGGLEVVPSLYNLLQRLRAEGYRVDGLPESERALAELIQRQGLVLEPYARGAIQDFFRDGDPALVDVETYRGWMRRSLRPELVRLVEEKYGPAPGSYLTTTRGGQEHVAVARVQLGNVVLLPQPLPGVGENTFKLVHGAGVAPPHPYVASYLWTRHAFQADAVVHFGTHGSLEFTPGKQIALSDLDWADALIGPTPHLYVYTVSNVGEGIIAKRRSYAATVTHLTPAFQESGKYEELKQLEERLTTWASLEDGSLRAQYARSLSAAARELDLYPALRLDPAHDLTDAQLVQLTNLVEEMAHEKVPAGLYTLGAGYRPDQVASTARLMAIDPVAFALADLDVAHGRVTEAQLQDATLFNQRYRARAGASVDRVLADPGGLEPELARLVGRSDLEAARAWRERTAAAATAHAGRGGPDGPGRPAGPGGPGGQPARGGPRAPTEAELRERRLAEAALRIEESLRAVGGYRTALGTSPRRELDGFVNALTGGYVSPSPGGDPIRNPSAVPTGRNLFSIDAERTPSPDAWAVGVKLAESLLERHRETHGRYPRKVSFTLWPGDFIATEGATIAQVLYLLGVEPVRDPQGRTLDVRLIPAEQLGRPRIDVVVQTAGQLRDLAASRLFLINKAVVMAAEATDGQENYVREGVVQAEQVMKERGLSPRDARALSTARVFGGVGGAYGTNIMGMVESGDRWDDESQVADTYLNNMGAVYDAEDRWGDFQAGAFEAALQNTEVVVQPRESNTWGPLSLDHVYEFMGGLNLAVRKVTGRDPDAYFNDYRNPDNPRVQELTEAIWVEARTTLLNPHSIEEYLKGGASSAEKFAETFRNTYGWNVMKPDAVDGALWNQLHEVYVRDRHDLGVHGFFERENPYALQEMTAVMLETVRKGYWNATPEQVGEIAALHGRLIQEHGAGCSGFVCDNQALQEFIRERLDAPAAEAYAAQIAAAREVGAEGEAGVTLERESLRSPLVENLIPSARSAWILAGGLLVLGLLALFVVRRRREASWSNL